MLILATDEELCKKLGKNAYETMTTAWSHKEAAKRLHHFCEELLMGKVVSQEDYGPMSKAPDIVPRKGYQFVRR